MFGVDGTPEGIRIIHHMHATVTVVSTLKQQAQAPVSVIAACPNAVMSSNLKRIAVGKLTLQWSSH